MTHSQNLSILHIDTGRNWRGGQNQLRLLLDGLNKEGVRSFVACPEGAPHTERFSCHQRIRVSFRGVNFLWTAKKLLDLVRDEGIQLIHAHTSQAHSLTTLMKLTGCRIPVIVHRRVMFPPGKGLLSAWKYHPKRVDHYVAVSKAVKNVLVGSGSEKERVSVIYSALESGARATDAQRQEAARVLSNQLGLPQNARTIGFCGALTSEKGCEDLIRAFNRIAPGIKDLYLIIAGQGPLETSLKDLAKGLGLLKRVFFPGFLADTDHFLRAVDCLVFPSHSEGLGTTLLQSAVQGCPVIGTRTGGIPEIIHSEQTGLLVPVANPGALAAAMTRYIQEPAFARNCAISLHDHVLDVFSSENLVREHIRLYQNLV